MDKTIATLKAQLKATNPTDKNAIIGVINNCIVDVPLRNLLKLTISAGVYFDIATNSFPDKTFVNAKINDLIETNLWPFETAKKAVNYLLELFRNEDIALFKVKVNNLWGFMDSNGVIKIDPQWTSITNFSNGRATAKLYPNSFSIINELGDEIFRIDASFMRPFSQNLSVINKGGELKNKKIVGGLYGIVDWFGNEILSVQYDAIFNFTKRGLAIIKRNGLYGIINLKGTFILDCDYEAILAPTESMIAIQKNGKWGYTNEIGHIIIEPKFVAVRQFDNNLAIVKMDDGWSVINAKGELVTNFSYDFIGKFNNGFAWVNNGGSIVNKIVVKGKWGFIDTNGNEIIKLDYDWVGSFNCGFAPVRKGDKTYYIDENGKICITPVNSKSLGGFSEGLAWVKKSRGYGLIDIEGNPIIEDKDIQTVTPYKNGRTITMKYYEDSEFEDADEYGYVQEYKVTKTAYTLRDREFNYLCSCSDGITEIDTDLYKLEGRTSTGYNSVKPTYCLFYKNQEILSRKDCCDEIYKPQNGLMLINRDFRFSYIDYNGIEIGPSWVEESERKDYYNWLYESHNYEDE